MSDAQAVVGTVTAVSGSQVTARVRHDVMTSDDLAPAMRLGGLVKLITAHSTIFGIVDELNSDAANGAADQATGTAIIDLLGEVMRNGTEGPDAHFKRGVSVYPTLGTEIRATDTADIREVYAAPSEATVRMGTIYQDPDVAAYLMTDPLLGKHFAVLGTTGSGKSCTVALILRSILNAHGNGHVVLLDAHAEYGSAFRDLAEVIDISNLQLPYWLLDFEEAVEVFVRAGDEAEREPQVMILKDAILQAKHMYAGEQADLAAITVDTPVPYRLGDLISTIDKAMGRLDKPDGSIPYQRLMSRIDSLNNDARFGFMFPGRIVRDNLEAILSRLLRIPVAGKPLTIMDISGVPSEVVDAVVSVLCRTIFDFALWGDRGRSVPVLLVCEEAHRYIPSNEVQGFDSTRRAITRIAKEGRKYGVSLCLVTQRPSELSASILSQCGTLFALRMNNELDQNFVRRALPENAAGLLGVLPELRTQEALVVGEGVSVPMRVRLDDLDPEHQPRSENAIFSDAWQRDQPDTSIVAETIRRWRTQHRD